MPRYRVMQDLVYLYKGDDGEAALRAFLHAIARRQGRAPRGLFSVGQFDHLVNDESVLAALDDESGRLICAGYGLTMDDWETYTRMIGLEEAKSQ